MAHDAFRALVNLSDSPSLVPFLSEPAFLTFLVSYILVSAFHCIHLAASYQFLECRFDTCRPGIHATFQSKRFILNMCNPSSLEDTHYPHAIFAIPVFPNAVPLWNLFCTGALSISRTAGYARSTTSYRCIRRRRISGSIPR